MNITLIPRTVYILVGPSGCGKSSLMRSLDDIEDAQDCIVISSDACRQAFSGTNLPPHHPRMMEVSDMAFRLLENMLRGHLAYPVQTPAIFIDSTGFNPDFRESIKTMAKRAGYRCELIVFSYPTREYLEHSRPDIKEVILRRQIDRFKKEVLPGLQRLSYNKCTTIKSREDSKSVTWTWDRYGLVENNLPIAWDNEALDGIWLSESDGAENGPVTFIGDVHECVDELKEMLTLVEGEIFLIGDWIDKGNRTKEIIDFIIENDVGVIIGNHESYIFKRLNGLIRDPDLEMEKNYFTSLEILLNDQEYADKFKDIVRHSRVVVHYPASLQGRRSIIATHAPCLPKDLGNFTNSISVRNMINFRRKDFSEESVLSDLKEIESNYPNNGPWRVVGHIAHDGVELRRGCHWYIDTGLVHGNSLTAVTFHLNGEITKTSVPYKGTSPVVEKLLCMKEARYRPTRKDFDLDDFQLRLMNRMLKGGTRYISGTMAPAPAWDDELEGVTGAYEYFKRHGITKVIMEPKHMGSRGQVYLNLEDISLSYATSRSGVPIRHKEEEIKVMIQDLFTWLKETNWFKEVSPKKEVVLDCELMPWSLLGEDLIDREFGEYYRMVSREINTLSEDAIFQGFNVGFEHRTEERKRLLKVFKLQLDLYGNKDLPKMIIPFAVLAVDGSPWKWSPEDFLSKIGSPYRIIDLEDEVSRKQGSDWFETLSKEEGKEGVVIKPLELKKDVVPYMKVRNMNYLHLVYGYDYPFHLEKMIRTKNITGKAKLSVQEFDLANELLSVSMDDAEKRTDLICETLFVMKKESELDPRL